jgi:L,D-transpeptidase catalytic domain
MREPLPENQIIATKSCNSRTGWQRRIGCSEGSSMRFRSCLHASLAAAALMSFLVSAAGAHVLINVDKSSQQMTVSVDGTPRYHFIVSTGRPGLGTPSGTFHPQRMERTWFSKEYYNSPMPHAIFFHGGFAIHGSYEISQLGGPASHGCIRLHPDNAATLYGLVQQQGMEATTIVVSGEASARRPAQAESDYPPRVSGYGQPGYGQRGATYYQQPPYQQSPGYYQQQQRSYYGYPSGY